MKPRGVGVVGYGWVAEAHIDALNLVKGANVIAVCTSRELEAEALQRRHGHEIAIIHDLDELLSRSDIDVIDLCSKSNLHTSQAIAAARAGKHLIIEKPVALTLADLRAVEAAVEAAGVHTCVCFEVRFSPQFTATKSIVENGLIGPLHFGEVDYYHNIGPEVSQYDWNRLVDGGGSSLLSAGCHALDGLLMFMGSRVTEVSSYATSSPHPNFARYEYPTSSVTILRFANGAIGKVASVIDSHQPYYLRVHLVGSDGAILDGRISTTKIAGLDRDQWTQLGVILEGSAATAHEPYVPQFKAFFEALDADRDMPLTSLAEASHTFEVIFAADRSAELGRPVLMTEVGA
jgi:predicted dehydrogenase